MRTTLPEHIRHGRTPEPADAPPPVGRGRDVTQAILAERAAVAGDPPGRRWLRAVGVTSIVVASLTFMATGVKVIYLLVAVSQMSSPAVATGNAAGGMFATPTAPAPAPAAAAADADATPDPVARQASVDRVMPAFMGAQPLSEAQREQLGHLLRDQLPRILREGDAATAVDAEAAISGSGGTWGDHFFRLPAGIVNVTDDEARLTAVDGSVYVGTEPADEPDIAIAFPGFPGVQPDADVVERLVRRIERDAVLSAEQADRLRADALATGNFGPQAMFPPEAAWGYAELTEYVSHVEAGDDGSVRVFTDKGLYELAADGSATMRDTGVFPVTGRGRTGGTLALAGESLAALVAGLLLAAGIQTARGRRAGRTLHHLHLVVKLLAGGMAGVGWFLLVAEMPGHGTDVGSVWAVVLVGGGLLWAAVASVACAAAPADGA